MWKEGREDRAGVELWGQGPCFYLRGHEASNSLEPSVSQIWSWEQTNPALPFSPWELWLPQLTSVPSPWAFLMEIGAWRGETTPGAAFPSCPPGVPMSKEMGRVAKESFEYLSLLCSIPSDALFSSED